MFVRVKQYLSDWKAQQGINAAQVKTNDAQIGLNESHTKAILALMRRVEVLEMRNCKSPMVFAEWSDDTTAAPTQDTPTKPS